MSQLSVDTQGKLFQLILRMQQFMVSLNGCWRCLESCKLNRSKVLLASCHSK